MLMATINDVFSVIADMTARWNAKDAAAFVQVFTDDADFTDVIGQTARGRAAIEAQHRFPFTRTMRDAVLTLEETHVRALSADVQVALVRWTTTKNLSLDGTPAPDRKGNMHIVLQRTGGAWRVASVLNQDPMGIYGKQVADAGGL